MVEHPTDIRKVVGSNPTCPIRSCMSKTKLTIETNPPEILLSNLSFIDALMGQTVDDKQGIPFGIWISLSGRPGTCKSTLGLQILEGFGMHSDVETLWIDREMDSWMCHSLYNRLGLTNISILDVDSNCGDTLLDSIYQRATNLAAVGKKLVVLMDSWLFLCNEQTIKAQRELAEKLRANRDKYKNVIFITINHLTKTGAIGGPAEVQQKPDVLLSLVKKDNFIYLSAPKNRIVAPHAPDVIKLLATDKGLVESQEPDFISTNPMVKLWRKWNA